MKIRKDKGKIKKDLTGKKFKLLTVIKFDSWVVQGKNTRVTFWKCKCKCGNFTRVKGTHLTRGDTKSCGCYNPQRLESGVAASNLALNTYKRHAKERNYCWRISKKHVLKLFKSNCFYCNSSATNRARCSRGNGDFKYNGLDRYDNRYGYTVKNTVTACKNCNRMKSDMSVNDFFIKIKNIYNFSIRNKK